MNVFIDKSCEDITVKVINLFYSECKMVEIPQRTFLEICVPICLYLIVVTSKSYSLNNRVSESLLTLNVRL